MMDVESYVKFPRGRFLYHRESTDTRSVWRRARVTWDALQPVETASRRTSWLVSPKPFSRTWSTSAWGASALTN